MSETHITELASRPAVVRRFLDEYRAWISAKLQCRMEETVLLELDFSIVEFATGQVLSGVPLRGDDPVVVRELKKRVQSIDLPPGFFPMFQVHETRSPGRLTNRKTVFEAGWQDCVVVIRLGDFPAPFVAASIPISPGAGPRVSDTCDCVIVKREYASRFLEMIRRIGARCGSPSLLVHGSGRWPICRSTWDDLVLADSIVNLVRRDFEIFLGREEWFRRRRLPFRRGYLFHGPPGNGKTSVIRAMLHSANLDGHTIALFHERTDDIYLERMFQVAASTAPSLIVLEDIDRAFSPVPSSPTIPKAKQCPKFKRARDRLSRVNRLRFAIAVWSWSLPSEQLLKELAQGRSPRHKNSSFANRDPTTGVPQHLLALTAASQCLLSAVLQLSPFKLQKYAKDCTM